MGEPRKVGSLSLESLAGIQPGMARLMDEYGRRFWSLYYAGRARNWPLAAYMLKEMRKLGTIIPVVRPKYAEAMAEFEAAYVDPLTAAIEAEDGVAFEKAYDEALKASDDYHARFRKPFLRFRLPSHPPEWLEFDPGASR